MDLWKMLKVTKVAAEQQQRIGWLCSEVYYRPCQTFEIERFYKNSQPLLVADIPVKKLHRHGSKYAFSTDY